MTSHRLALIRQRYVTDGGAERFVARLLRTMANEDVELTLLTRAWRTKQDANVVKVNPFYLGRVWRDMSFARAVCRTVDKQRFDLVQSHERIACCDIYRAGDGVHHEWLAQRANILGPLGRLGLRLNPYHAYTRRAERKLFASSRLRAVICNSRMVKEEIERLFAVPSDRLHVIYSGVDTEAFHPVLRRYRGKIRRQYGIPTDALLFLFVGSGFERKGLAAAIGALAQVPKAHLLVVGRDKHRTRYESRAGSLGVDARVHFAGKQSDVKPYYGAADAFVLPTLYDPFPNVALEAFASGLPVLTSRKCGAAELIREGENGFVFDAHDVEAIANAMRALQSLERRIAMQDAARHTGESFDLTRMTDQYLALYRSFLGVPAEADA